MPARTRRLLQGVALVGFLAALGALIALIAWSDQPQVRYATSRCLYEKTFAQGGSVDVAIVGTSRAKMGVSPEGLSAALGGKETVVNIARSWRGSDFMLQQLRDLDEQRGIEGAIVVEYSREGDVVATTQRYYDYHPEHAALMPVARLLDDPSFKPREPWYLRIRDVLDFGQQRFEFALDRLIEGKASRNAVLAPDERPVVGSTGCTGDDRPLKQNALDAWYDKVVPDGGTWRDQKTLTPTWGAVNDDIQRKAIREMIAFAAERDVPIYFVLIPRYLDPPVDEAFVRRFEAEFGAPLLIPPPDVLDAMYDGGYSDPNHMHGPGRDVYTAWLAEQIGPGTDA